MPEPRIAMVTDIMTSIVTRYRLYCSTGINMFKLEIQGYQMNWMLDPISSNTLVYSNEVWKNEELWTQFALHYVNSDLHISVKVVTSATLSRFCRVLWKQRVGRQLFLRMFECS